MHQHKASYYFINLSIVTIFSMMMLTLISYATTGFERMITEEVCFNSVSSDCIFTSDSDSDSEQSDSYELLDNSLSSSFCLTHSSRVPSAQSLTKLSDVVSSVISILTHADIQTHDQLVDYGMADVLSICHRPSVYYIFALNRMRD